MFNVWDQPTFNTTQQRVPHCVTVGNHLGGGFKYLLFLPQKLGKISNLTNICQMG